MNANKMTQEYLKLILRYDSEIGRFFWIATRPKVVIGKMAGTLDKSGYRRIRIDGKDLQEHRLAWLYVYSEFPPDQLDHINHQKDDNRIENLRAVSRQENHRNMPMGKNNTSGVTGISWHKGTHKWQAKIKICRKMKYLGVFEDYFEAICCRKSADLQYGFHKNHGTIAVPIEIEE